MTPEREPAIHVDVQPTPDSELLAEVELFRNELYSIVPFGLNNPRYKAMVCCLAIAAHDIEIALRHSDDAGVLLDDFESRQKGMLLESYERFDELRRLRTEMTSLMESYKAEHS